MSKCTMKQPTEPSKEDCCDSGCKPCIFDVYEKQLKLYQKYLENGETENDQHLENGISQLEYTPFRLIQNVEICGSHKLLSFKKSNEDGRRVLWKPSDHFLIKYNSENKSCTRAYTPLSKKLINNKKEYDFSIIIKIYDKGLVSNYLKALKDGDCTLWRGPYGAYELSNSKYDRIIMIAQGTGIVAFIEIIEKILCNEEDMTRIVLYYCCQSVDNILFRENLYTFKAYWNFAYIIFLGNGSESRKYKYQEPITHHKLGVDEIVNLKPFSIKDQFLLCGSLQFMKAYETLLKNKNVPLENIINF